ncbi:MAG: ABC transporter ATP-binding protein, partial [Leptolyngbyaceae cyanobacterium bins.59]|nr:ABC transporter ATP-binding protein [Leptolyngbyaceae cyanobacterium bins.59]
MAKFTDVLKYYRHYWRITLFSVVMVSLFELIDLFTPYAIGQLLNVLSGQSLDWPLQRLNAIVSQQFSIPNNRELAL